MAYDRDGTRWSRTEPLVAASEHYLLDRREAQSIVAHQRSVIEDEWEEAAEVAQLTTADRSFLWRRQILNPFIEE